MPSQSREKGLYEVLTWGVFILPLHIPYIGAIGKDINHIILGYYKGDNLTITFLFLLPDITKYIPLLFGTDFPTYLPSAE